MTSRFSKGYCTGFLQCGRIPGTLSDVATIGSRFIINMFEGSAMHSICILIATYDSSKFLQEQLDSIVQQDCFVNKIIVSDDGSTDNTLDIIGKFRSRESEIEVSLNANNSGEKGPKANFAHLCSLAVQHHADYYFFCDHDDVWAADKISKSVAQLKRLEHESSTQTPILIHTELEVMDEAMLRSFGSLSEYQGLPPAKLQPLSALLHQNVVTGCSVGFNYALLGFATPVPRTAIMHDHWFAICAKSVGIIEYLPELLVRYRQHSNNSIGALNASVLSNYFSAKFYLVLLRFPGHFMQCTLQAEALHQRLERYHIQPSSYDRNTITIFASLASLGLFSRIITGLQFFEKPRPVLTCFYQIAVLLFLPAIRHIYRARK